MRRKIGDSRHGVESGFGRLRRLTANTKGNNTANTLAAVITGTGPLELRYTGEPGHAYRLQASTDFIDWLDLATNTPINGLIRCGDSDATNLDRRFYRAVSP